MKVALVDPKGYSDCLNTGLGYISAALEREGHEIMVIDLNNKKGGDDRRILAAKDADIVGFSIKSATLKNAVATAEKIRKLNKKAVFIAGGPHMTIDGYNFMKERCFDIAVVGEGEKTMCEIAAGKKLEKISGIIFRKGSKIISNRRKEWIKNLDELTFPDYGFFDSVKGKIGAYPIVTSRGCPYNCTYCSVGDIIGKRWRARSPENIIKELFHAKEHYGSNKFKVLDDDFTLDMNRAKKLCRMMIDESLDMEWSCPNGIRADRLDMELLTLMKESGCYSISLGIESLVPDVFEKIDKGEKLDDVKNAVANAKKAGIRVEGFFIIGLPGSTYEKDKLSIKEAKKLRLDNASWGILVPYPGTKVWEWVVNNKDARMLRDWRDGFHLGIKPEPTFETKDYTASERLKAYYLANMSFAGKKTVAGAIKMIFKKI